MTNPAEPGADQDEQSDEDQRDGDRLDDDGGRPATEPADEGRSTGQEASTARQEPEQETEPEVEPASDVATVPAEPVEAEPAEPVESFEAAEPFEQPRTAGAGMVATATGLLAVAGGLAIGGSFGLLEEESEQAGNQTLTLSYTSWRLIQGGNYPSKIYFHAPHFGIPLVATGILVVLGGLSLVLGRPNRLAGPLAAVAAALLVGTVWTICMVVSADLDAVDRTTGFALTWTSGIGFWLVLAAGVAAAIGGILALLTVRTGPPILARPSPGPREPRSA